jgi:hypothetical protein
MISVNHSVLRTEIFDVLPQIAAGRKELDFLSLAVERLYAWIGVPVSTSQGIIGAALWVIRAA